VGAELSQRAAAARQMFELLSVYLAAYLVEGANFESALRPVPTRLRLRIQLESALAKITRHLDRSLPLSREENYLIPVSEVAAHAHC
jgi:hypothetical protein